MILAATREQATKTRRRIDLPGLFCYYKAEWLQTEPAQGLPSPLVYLVEQPPRSVLPTHFHRQNQFQVFVGGGGMFGPRPIIPGVDHRTGDNHGTKRAARHNNGDPFTSHRFHQTLNPKSTKAAASARR